jgi:hypothetical protein
MDPAWWIDALLSPQGQALLEQLSMELLSGESELRIISRFRERYPPDWVSAALSQARLRIRARSKFTNADRMYFTQPGLEQASSERMAWHHARRYDGFEYMADLCTGIGGDLLGLAAGRSILSVDLDPVHARLAYINAQVNNVAKGVRPVCADVRDLRLTGVPAVFIDPARRSEERRFGPGASEPPLAWCFALVERVSAVGIKAGPALPAELVPSGWELEFASERRELKEALLWSPALATAARRATVLPEGYTLTEESGVEIPIKPPGNYLIDPDPAVTRAGLVEELARSLGHCWKIDSQVAFLSTDSEVRTPFGRTLAIEASMPWSLARLREQLRALRVGTVDIRKRGSAVDVEELQRRLKLSGNRSATVVLTRVSNRPWTLVCTVPPSDSRTDSNPPVLETQGGMT